MRAAALVLWVLLAGCGEGTTTPATPPPPASVEREIVPDATDPAIDVSLEPHFAINPSPSVAARGRLFVFLPGTGGVPSQYRLILRTGAGRGYHAIGLNYPNETAVGVLCDGGTDQDCHWDVRREVITGEDTSPLVSVSPANSIVNRLEKLLSYLQAQHPKEGWGQYLSEGAVVWSNVVVAGHSQGGGHAGAMAKLYSLRRSVYFSSPADWNSAANAPPSWVERPSATDVSRQYGFSHEQDALVLLSRLLVTWRQMGLEVYGAPVSVDGAGAPYGNSHELTTRAIPNHSGGGTILNHAATVADAATPVTGTGAPRFAPVWIYLCFP